MPRDVSLPRVCFRCSSPAAPKSDYCPACIAAMRRSGLSEFGVNWEKIARLLSVVPLLLGPPVAALLISYGASRSQTASSPIAMFRRTTIAISVANIVLSLLVWHVAAEHLASLAVEMLAWLRALIGLGALPPATVIGA